MLPPLSRLAPCFLSHTFAFESIIGANETIVMNIAIHTFRPLILPYKCYPKACYLFWNMPKLTPLEEGNASKSKKKTSTCLDITLS